MRQSQAGETNRLLGYPADARLLIINADDLGMCHAVNQAVIDSFKNGVLCSTSLMVPCPWARHAMHLLRENPGTPFAIHLTVLCDTSLYSWGPLTSKEKVPSLVDQSGVFYTNDRMAEFLAQVDLHELELEFRAQIDAVLSAGLKPTNLDWHCLHNGGSPDILEMTFGLAREYGLAVRVTTPTWVEKLQNQGLPTNDYELLDSYSMTTVDKTARYVQLLRELPVGLSEWAVHPGFDHPELRTIEPGPAIRPMDYEFLISPAARETVQQEGITLLDYRPIQQIWQER